MIWISALLVFASVAVVLLNLGSQSAELHLGFQQLIHARTPWLLLGALFGGCALGFVAVVRRPSRYRVPVVAVEVAFAALVSWFVLFGTELPRHELSVAVGDPFPAYSLLDQEGRRADFSPATADGPALYIFYRGDW